MTSMPTPELLLSDLTIWTVRFGAPEQVAVPASSLYTFPEALPGLPESRRFALIAEEGYAPLRWLQSLDEGIICLPVLALEALPLPGYAAHVAAAAGLDGADLGGRVLLVTHFDAEAGRFAVNLLAPIVLDHHGATGRQVILEQQSYPLRRHLEWDAARREFSLPC